jgi:hypothetical protein
MKAIAKDFINSKYTKMTFTNKCFFSANGEVIVTLLPVNERFPWVTPARFRPELVPEELMAPVLTVNTPHGSSIFYSWFSKTCFTII